jgi:hypothetical protein
VHTADVLFHNGHTESNTETVPPKGTQILVCSGGKKSSTKPKNKFDVGLSHGRNIS